MDNSEIAEIIRSQFLKMAGANIKINSYVCKFGDKRVFQVTEKDSKLVKCRIALDLFSEKKEGEDFVVFNKKDVCLYFDLLKAVNRRIERMRFNTVEKLKEGRE